MTDVAARLPLRIVCDLMGIPDSYHDFVFDQSNIVLGAADEEYVPDFGDLVTAILTAGEALTQLMDEVAESKVGVESDDLTSILVNAEVDGERLTRAELASFFITAGGGRQRDHPQRHQLGPGVPDRTIPTSAASGPRTSRASPTARWRRSCASPARSPTCAAPRYATPNWRAPASTKATRW